MGNLYRQRKWLWTYKMKDPTRILPYYLLLWFTIYLVYGIVSFFLFYIKYFFTRWTNKKIICTKRERGSSTSATRNNKIALWNLNTISFSNQWGCEMQMQTSRLQNHLDKRLRSQTEAWPLLSQQKLLLHGTAGDHPTLPCCFQTKEP